MNNEGYFVVCNPCNEQVIATDVLLLNVNGFKPNVTRDLMNNEFIPLVLYKHYGKVYKCSECKLESGVLAPENPKNLKLFTHYNTCSNKNKFPVEI